MPENDLQTIKDKIEITEFIAKYIPVKRSGSNFKAVCPFHNEKSASLMISQSKQIWHCFGCGLGGDIFGFLMRYENLDFVTALKSLAEIAGVELQNYKSDKNEAQKQLNQNLARINNFACSFFEKQLLDTVTGKVALEYLLKRGLTNETIARWRIGFAQNSFDALRTALETKKVNLDMCVQAGVLVKSEKGKVFDRFRGRIIFPIMDINNTVVGFTARVLPGSDQAAKYINSPETNLYNKSEIIFGLNLAKDAIRTKGYCVIMEGQMDCISAHSAGFTNTIATSGTALTTSQLKLLKRFTTKLVMAFDGDDAGKAALHRAMLLALPLGFEVKVISSKAYGKYKDPDEVIQSSPALWKKSLEQASRGLEYYLNLAQTEFAASSLEQKHFITNYVLPLVKVLPDPIDQDHYTQKISQDFSISAGVLRGVLTNSSPTSYAPENKTPIQATINPESIWEKEIIGGLLVVPEVKQLVLSEGLETSYFSKAAADLFTEIIASPSKISFNSTFAQECVFVVESLLENLNNNQLALLRELKKSFYLFKRAWLNKELAQITIALKQAELNKNLLQAKELSAAFHHKSTERFKLEIKLNEA